MGNPPGLNGYWEMRDWAQAGVSREAIFQAATVDNARVFGLDDDVGTVEVGKRANLLLMSQDPIENISAYDSIGLVVLNGRVIDRRSLAADAGERGTGATE